jgi:hypothetical protein
VLDDTQWSVSTVCPFHVFPPVRIRWRMDAHSWGIIVASLWKWRIVGSVGARQAHGFRWRNQTSAGRRQCRNENPGGVTEVYRGRSPK